MALAPETNGGIIASVFVTEDTDIVLMDSAAGAYRTVVLKVGELSMHLGLFGGDAEVVVVADRLIVGLTTLREAAAGRIEPPMPTWLHEMDHAPEATVEGEYARG